MSNEHRDKTEVAAYERYLKHKPRERKDNVNPFDGPKTETGELIIDEQKIWEKYNDQAN